MSDRKQMLENEYQLRFSDQEIYRNQVWQVLCEDFFSSYIDVDANILDLGCGWGEFINNISAGKKFAMDMNPDAKGKLSSGIHFLHQDCSEPWPLEPASLDIVFSSNFLEHLPDKDHVEKTIAHVSRALKPGGRVVFMGPNIRYIPGAYWDFWDHYVPITDLSMAELLKLNNFDISRNISRFLPYTMSNGKPPPLFMLKAYLKLPIFWPLFGRQFLVIGEKKRSTTDF